MLVWIYYISAGEEILSQENWVVVNSNIQHVYSTTQIPLMPVFPILNILIYLAIMLIDYAGGMVE